MRKTLRIVLILALCLTLSGASAESWTCSKCGGVCSGNFCPNCGTLNPIRDNVSPLIGGLVCTQAENGDTLVSWPFSKAKGPFKLDYTVQGWKYCWFEDDSYSASPARLCSLVPGAVYIIRVFDLDSLEYSTVNYEVPVPLFREWRTMHRYLRLTQTSFSLSQAKKDILETFQLRISFPLLKRAREYQGKLVLTFPGGFCPDVFVYDLVFTNRAKYLYANYSLYLDFLEDLEDEYGSAPLGTYTLSLYLNGSLYDSIPFELTE